MTDIYQQIILDHFKNPRRYFSLSEHDVHVSGDNSLCGDDVGIFLKLDDQQRLIASFTGKGCAISQASASIMVEAMHGLSLAEAHALTAQYLSMFEQGSAPEVPPAAANDGAAIVSSLAALAMVHRYPMRIKCAKLSWGVMAQALTLLTSRGGNTP